jgi:hypothetical protein
MNFHPQSITLLPLLLMVICAGLAWHGWKNYNPPMRAPLEQQKASETHAGRTECPSVEHVLFVTSTVLPAIAAVFSAAVALATCVMTVSPTFFAQYTGITVGSMLIGPEYQGFLAFMAWIAT